MAGGRWYAANVRATNASEVDEFIKPEYRKGWSLRADLGDLALKPRFASKSG